MHFHTCQSIASKLSKNAKTVERHARKLGIKAVPGRGYIFSNAEAKRIAASIVATKPGNPAMVAGNRIGRYGRAGKPKKKEW